MLVESHLKAELLLQIAKEGLNVYERFRYIVRCSFLREASVRSQSKCSVLCLKDDDTIYHLQWGEKKKLKRKKLWA